MLLIGPSFFILGLVVASVTAEETSTHNGFSTTEFDPNNTDITTTTENITSTSRTTSTMDITSTSRTTSTMDITSTNSTIAPSTTKQKGDESTKGSKPTPAPIDPWRPTTTTPVTKITAASDSTGIIILVLIILVALGFGVACYLARKRERHYSVNLVSRADETNIPLSIMDPELPADTVSQNGLQTFESTELITKEPQEPEAKPEVQEEQKAEADKSVVDPSAESAAPAPSPDSAEDKPKEDVVEQSPPAPVEPSVEEKTDDEAVVSNKTSAESLKETNENNSNNADFSQKRDVKSSNIFWDVPLNCPV